MSPESELLLDILGVFVAFVVGIFILFIIVRHFFISNRSNKSKRKSSWKEFSKKEKKKMILFFLSVLFFPLTILYFLFKFLKWLFPRIFSLIKSASSNGGFLKFSTVVVFTILFILMYKQSVNSSIGVNVTLDPNTSSEWYSEIKERRKSTPVVGRRISVDYDVVEWKAWAKKQGYDTLFHEANAKWGKFCHKWCKELGFSSWVEFIAAAPVESANDTDAISRKGAVGVWQVKPKTAQEIISATTVKDLKDPFTNAYCAIGILANFQKDKKIKSQSDIWLCYNQGKNGAKKVVNPAERVEYYNKILGTIAAAKDLAPIDSVGYN